MDLKRFYIYTVILLFNCIILRGASGQTYENATKLKSDLLSGYDKDIRPMNNQSAVLHVNVTLDLFGIPEVDDVKGILSIVVAPQCEWIDERMTWNPADYGGISKVLILMNDVWTPSTSLGTPVEFATMGSSINHVIFYANGLAFFYPGAVLKSSCGFNMKFWPFDKQVCNVGFFPLDYTKDQVIFSVPIGVRPVSFTANAEWMLDKTEHYVSNVAGFSMAFFRFKLKRQSLFYILTIILPINGIAGLTCLVFLLPAESGERVSYAITIMLSLAVFLTVVSAEMPKSSEPISLMCCYILAGICVSVIGAVLAILNLAIYYRNENVPKRQWYISLVLFSRCKRNNKVQDEPEELKDLNNTKYTNVSNQLFIKTRKSKTNVLSVKSTVNEQPHDDIITWPDVSKAIDTLLFVAMVLFTYVPSLGFLIYLGAASDYQM